MIQNPFFRQHDSSDISSDSESEFDSESESEDEPKEEETKSNGAEDDEDPLIKALKAAKERKHTKANISGKSYKSSRARQVFPALSYNFHLYIWFLSVLCR